MIALVFVTTVVPQGNSISTSTAQALKQIDFGGSLTLPVSIGALLQLLSRNSIDPLSDDTFGVIMAVVSPAFFCLFIYVELKLATKPILPLSLLSRRTPLCVGIIAGVIAAVNFNMLYHLP